MPTLEEFIIQYERRHAELEQKFAVQANTQQMRDEQTIKELTSLHAGIDDIKRTLTNGLLTRVTSIEETVKQLKEAPVKSGIATREFWEPILRDFVRVGMIIVFVLVLQHVPMFLAGFGIRLAP